MDKGTGTIMVLVGAGFGFIAGALVTKYTLEKKFEVEKNDIAVQVSKECREKYCHPIEHKEEPKKEEPKSEPTPVPQPDIPKGEVADVEKLIVEEKYYEDEDKDQLEWIPEDWVGKNGENEIFYFTYYPNRDDCCVDEQGNEVDLTETIGESNVRRITEDGCDIVCVRNETLGIDLVVTKDNRRWSDTVKR